MLFLSIPVNVIKRQPLTKDEKENAKQWQKMIFINHQTMATPISQHIFYGVNETNDSRGMIGWIRSGAIFVLRKKKKNGELIVTNNIIMWFDEWIQMKLDLSV